MSRNRLRSVSPQRGHYHTVINFEAHCIICDFAGVFNSSSHSNFYLRATASKYRESADSEENSDFLLLRQKDPFGELYICRNILSKFQRVHIFVKSRKVQNTAQSTKLADGIYPKLYIYRKLGICLGFHIHTVCNLLFGHSSELKVILN